MILDSLVNKRDEMIIKQNEEFMPNENKILPFPASAVLSDKGVENVDGILMYTYANAEGVVVISEGDCNLTIAQALSLLDRCAIQIKKDAGWL